MKLWTFKLCVNCELNGLNLLFKIINTNKKKTNGEKSRRSGRQANEREKRRKRKRSLIKSYRKLESKQLALKFDTFGWMHFNGFLLPWNMYTTRKWHTGHFSLAILYKQKNKTKRTGLGLSISTKPIIIAPIIV